MRHLMSDKDFEARTAVCSICGPVRMRKIGPNWRCWEVTRIQRQRDKIKKKYGINWQEWNALLIAQTGRCLICNDPMQQPYVDHCHKTAAIRGLLCTNCNSGLGMFHDDPSRLQAAIEYLIAPS